MEPIFPFVIGPKYYGCQFNTKRKCCSSVYAKQLLISNLDSKELFDDQCIEISNKNSKCDKIDNSNQFKGIQTEFSDIHRHLESTELVTPVWTLTPTLTPTRFSSPTIKPSIDFLSQQPTQLTMSPSTSPTTTKERKTNEEKIFTDNNIVFIALIVVGGIVILVSLGILIYWRIYTRTGEEYQDASSSTYIEKIKDFTVGISLVER